ncbi:MAG TPA: DUF5615 family PIN-like protein [Chloroflexota bacterium]|nr:DUF5615 family PIN-like protein [Chloroflexota bacterium]
MKFLLDQSTDARLVPYLQQRGHDVSRVGRDYPSGLPDDQVLAIAHAEQRILITDDRDFGELVFRLGYPHAGIIFLRLGAFADLATRMDRINHVLVQFADRLDQFLVVSQTAVRVRSR